MFVRTNTAAIRGLRGLRGLRRGLRRGLGCACGPKKLGQDGSEEWGGFDSGSSPAPVFGPPAPTIAQVQANQDWLQSNASNPAYAFQPITTPPFVSSPGGSAIPVFNNPAVSPLSMPGTSMQTSGANAGSLISGTTAGGLSQATLNAYLPYIALAIGGIAFISVLKKR